MTQVLYGYLYSMYSYRTAVVLLSHKCRTYYKYCMYSYDTSIVHNTRIILPKYTSTQDLLPTPYSLLVRHAFPSRLRSMRQDASRDLPFCCRLNDWRLKDWKKVKKFLLLFLFAESHGGSLCHTVILYLLVPHNCNMGASTSIVCTGGNIHNFTRTLANHP